MVSLRGRTRWLIVLLVTVVAVAAAVVQTIRLGAARSRTERLARAAIARCNAVHEMFASARQAHDAGQQHLAVDLYEHNAASAIACSLDRKAMQAALTSGDVAKILELDPIRELDDVEAADRLARDD